jgi:acyl-CoA thioesterase
MAKESRPPMGFQKVIGLDVYQRADGMSRARITIGDEHMNPHGVVHGAVIYALADTGMGAALYTRLDEAESCATIEIKIAYIASAREGELECETRLISKGRRVAFLESEVRSEGKLVAKAMGTFAVFEIRA